MVEKQEQVIWNVLLTDVEFGFDGNMYVSDWVNGWGMTGKGRLYRLASSEKDTAADGVKKLFAQGFGKLKDARLAKLLSHADMRVRQASQFELAKRKNVKALAKVAAGSENQLARLHGIWGVGQISRRDASANAPLLPLLKDADAEVRAQTLKVLGDAGYNAAHATVVTLLRDKSARVRALLSRSSVTTVALSLIHI